MPNDADLSNATLTGAFLGNTIMNRAALTGARLNGAILEGAQLNGAYLSGANLNGADLTGTDLSGADLSDADLIAPGLTQQQLDTVYSCTNAISIHRINICHISLVSHLTYWYTESRAEARVISKLIGQFEQQYPKIHINACEHELLPDTDCIRSCYPGGQCSRCLAFRRGLGRPVCLAGLPAEY